MTGRRKILVVGAFACLAAVAVSLLLLKHWATGPNDGTVHIGKPAAQAQETPEAPPTRVGINTDYFTASLPTGFNVKRQDTSPNGLSLLELVADDKHQQLAITIANLPSEGLASVGDYRLRVTDTTRYAPYRPAGMPVDATAFQALEGPPALVAFWPSGTQYAEIALTSDNSATLSQLFNNLVQLTHTWSWQ